MSITLVTGLWNINRDSLNDGWSRCFQHYINKLEQLLEVENNMIIFGDENIEDIVWNKRSYNNTKFILRNQDWFKDNEYFDKIQNIRNNPDWYNQASWLTESTQARLEMYNPLVMSKMFLLHDAKILDPFNSDYMFWIDAGIANTVPPGYFIHDKVLNKLPNIVSKFSFVCFPYEADQEVHGFKYRELCKIAKYKTNKVARGGFFGGPKDSIAEVNSLYYDLLIKTLKQSLMGTEESIFTLMIYLYPELFQYAEIQSNGLMGKFFEDLKNNAVKFKSEISLPTNKPFTDKSALYAISYNSPKQFQALIESIKKYDENFLNMTTKFLLDNSTDESTLEDYKKICAEYNFEHIKKDNLGICGGRQFIAEHFDTTELKYMFFFEDDMFFNLKKGDICKNGFNRYIKGLYYKVLNIMTKEDYDFLKLSFTEFYGDNSTQWAWYNVPQDKREEHWPEYSKLPEHGLDKNSPKTVFKNIKSLNGLPYADGEIYYSNWPQIITKEANKKMFLDTRWAHPFEQIWMSHFFQMTKRGELNPAILLLSPIEHDRFDHYDSYLRKES